MFDGLKHDDYVFVSPGSSFHSIGEAMKLGTKLGTISCSSADTYFTSSISPT